MQANSPAVALLTHALGQDAETDWRDAEIEAAELRARLAKANALLRTLRRLEPKPARAEGIDDDPEALAAIAQAVYLATLRARIDHYFQSVK